MGDENGPGPAMRDENHSHPVDAAILEPARRQHGIVAHRELVSLGLSRSAIGRRGERGWLVVLHRGVYAIAYERDRERDRILDAAGWRPVRITWRQLTQTPDEVERDLRRMLRAA